MAVPKYRKGDFQQPAEQNSLVMVEQNLGIIDYLTEVTRPVADGIASPCIVKKTTVLFTFIFVSRACAQPTLRPQHPHFMWGKIQWSPLISRWKQRFQAYRLFLTYWHRINRSWSSTAWNERLSGPTWSEKSIIRVWDHLWDQILKISVKSNISQIYSKINEP